MWWAAATWLHKMPSGRSHLSAVRTLEPESDPEPELALRVVPKSEMEPVPEGRKEPTQEPKTIRSSIRSVFRRRVPQTAEPEDCSSREEGPTDAPRLVEARNVASVSVLQTDSELDRDLALDLERTRATQSPARSAPSDTEGRYSPRLSDSNMAVKRTSPTKRPVSPQVSVRVKKRSEISHPQVSTAADSSSREGRRAAAIKLAEERRQRERERDDRVALIEKQRAARSALRKQRLLDAQSKAKPFRVASQIPRHRSPQPHAAREAVHSKAQSPARQHIAFGSASPSGRLATDTTAASTTGVDTGTPASRDHSRPTNSRRRVRSATPTKSSSHVERKSRIARLSTPTRRRPLPNDSTRNFTGSSNAAGRSQSTPLSRYRSKSPVAPALAFGSKLQLVEPRANPQSTRHPHQAPRKQLKNEVRGNPIAIKMLSIWTSEVRLLSQCRP